MRLGWPFAALLEVSPAQLDATRVDCGTCPVSIQCLAGDGGNGWRFDCCGATGVQVADGDGQLLLVMDCADNAFKARMHDKDLGVCPLCSGDLLKAHVLGMTDHHRYVPTAHAKHSTSVRIAQIRKKLPEAIALKKRIDERSSKP